MSIRSAWPKTLPAGFLALFLGAITLVEDGGTPIYTAYRDPVGVITTCGGLTNSATQPVGHTITVGQTYTQDQCQALFNAIAQRFNAQIRACVHVPVLPREVFAYLHFAWNIGTGAFCASTLVRKLNAYDYAGACDQIKVWMRAGGRDCRVRANNCYGIVVRREIEHAMCTGRVDIPGLGAVEFGK